MNEPNTQAEIEALALSDIAPQLHIIVGGGGRCLCGMYDGQAMSCQDILFRKSPEIQHALMMANCGGTRIPTP